MCPQVVFFQGKWENLAFLGAKKEGVGEKNEVSERKETITKGQNQEKIRTTKIIRVG